jgi:lysozyme
MNTWHDSIIKYKVSEDMVVSDEWKMLVTNFEGLVLTAYPDPGSGDEPWTVGYGHTLGVKPGDVITEERATELLYEDVKRFEASVNRQVIVPLTQYQFNALTSFTFNVGGGNLKSSTLLKKLNRGDYDGAASEFGKWVYASGKKLNGLIRRRAAEEALFRGQYWSQ